MENEKLTVEYKSIKKIRSGGSGFNDLAITCVGFANAIGGHIYILVLKIKHLRLQKIKLLKMMRLIKQLKNFVVYVLMFILHAVKFLHMKIMGNTL